MALKEGGARTCKIIYKRECMRSKEVENKHALIRYKASCNHDITHIRECGKSEKSRKFQRLLEEKLP